MSRKLTLRQLLVWILSLYYDLSQKEIEALAGLPDKSLSQYLRRGEIKDGLFERLMTAMRCKPAAIQIVTACLEALDGLEAEDELSDEDRAQIELAVLEVARMIREELSTALKRARNLPLEGYPQLADVAAARWKAGEQWEEMKDLPEETVLDVIAVGDEHQTWWLCEKVCEESVSAASQDLERAASLARLAQEIADRVRGPESWCHRLRGYAMAHGANVLKVGGHLEEADVTLEEAKRHWHGGSDPDGILDPGRLLHLEGSLRRAQRRFNESLALLEEAVEVSQFPERGLLIKGFTFEVMGKYEQAVETLHQAEPLIDQRADPRQWYILRLNLATNYCHLGRFKEAEALVAQARPLVGKEEKIDRIRISWLEARIAAGLGRTRKARTLLEQARRAFMRQGMIYDVSLALLEEAILLLKEGQTAEVRTLTQELAIVFESKKVHREALAALRLFHEAALNGTATEALGRRIVHYLYRAREDQGLPFTS